MTPHDKYYFRDYRARKRREREAHKARQTPAMVLAVLLGDSHEQTGARVATATYGLGPGGARRMVQRSADEIDTLRERAVRRARELRAWLDVDVDPDAPGGFDGPVKQGERKPAPPDAQVPDMQAAIRELLAIEECLAELGKADQLEQGDAE